MHRYDDTLQKCFFQYCENLVIKYAIVNKHIIFYTRYVDNLKICDHIKINSKHTLKYTNGRSGNRARDLMISSQRL
jgi:hypothetical protein